MPFWPCAPWRTRIPVSYTHLDVYKRQVYSQMVAGRDAATFGEAKNSWLTGTAAWTFVDVSQYILGLSLIHIFSGQLKKYKVTINDLLAENEQLEARAKASEKGKKMCIRDRQKGAIRC